MLKRLVLVTTLGLAIMVPVVSAQNADAGQAPTRGLRATGRLLRMQVRRGVRLGQITPAERAQLRAKAQDLRSWVRSLRQGGQRLTLEQRQEFRQRLRQLRRDIVAARRNR
jgi:hypothetical protein